MMRLINMAMVVVTLGVALHVYTLEMQSRAADKKLVKLKVAIAEERETIRRLRAEWSHLNTPARLEKLSTRHLEHAASTVSQVLREAEIDTKIPSLQTEAKQSGKDPIADMLAGNAITGSVAPPNTPSGEVDLIGNILKGLD